MSNSEEESPAGILLSIHMINFMKHDNLLIDLKPHANFITGRNGSGKSSILVALAVGLGSNTRLSGRGNNMSDLIKDGRNEATIIVTIKNTPGGYRMDLYGDTIVITRKITRSSSRFDIANLPKTTATQVREELNHILQFYNIQIDNPCSIMHQDTAREFIGVSTPQKKYDLFMRGTLLTRLTDDIFKIKSNIENVQRQKDDRLVEKADLDQQFDEIKRKNDIVEEADGLLNRIHDLENELVWSYYHVAAVEKEKADSELAEYIEKQNKANEKVEEKQKIANEAKKELEKYRLQVQEAMKEISKVRDEKDKLAKKLDQIRLSLSTQKNQLKHCVNSIARSTTDIQNKKNDKIKLEKKRDESQQQLQEQRNKYIAKKEKEHDEVSSRLRDAENQLEIVERDYQNIIPDLDNLKLARSDAINNFSEVSAKLQQLQRFVGRDNDGSTSLINKINNERNFTFVPIGPISRYIKLREKEWGVAVQHIIGKMLDCFIVNNHNDEIILRRIAGENLKIIIINFTRPRFRYRSDPPCPGARLVIDVLNIQNEVIQGLPRSSQSNARVNTADVILNALVDINNVDNIWCIEDESIARKLSFGQNHLLTILKSGVQFKYQSGYEVRIGAKWNTCKIGVDESQRIEKLKRDLEEAKNAKNRVENDYQICIQRAKSIKAERSKLENIRSSCKKELNKIEVQLSNPPDEADNYDAQIDAIESRIKELTSSIEKEKESQPKIEQKIKELQEEKKSIIEEIKELSAKLDSSDDFKTKSDEYFNKEKHAQLELTKEKNIARSLSEKVDKLKEVAKNAHDNAEENLKKARLHSPDCEEKYKDVARAPKPLAQLLMEEKKKYEVAQNISGLDFAEIRKQYSATKSQVEKAVRFLNELQEFLEQANAALNVRQEKLKTIIHSVTRRAKVSFLNYQRQRKYNGKLHFQHEQKTIEIAVKSKADTEYTDVSNLSGGEKSYCLVSLLLSLWEVMECPFYCVDEFDVFMDDINRQAATTLLVKGASVMENRQFIFITPLSLNNLKNDEKVTIFEVEKTDS